MHRVFFKFLVTALSFSIGGALATDLQLSLDLLACKMPPGKPLPAKYYNIARKWKEYRWVTNVRPGDLIASGSGDERVDGSRMFDWYTFGKLDINGDGVCDWFLTSLAPYSTGGDGGVLNTLYLGGPTGWRRVGARIPGDKPDGLGWGNAGNDQANFTFSSDVPLTLWDEKNRTPYLIGWFDNRHEPGRSMNRYGYRIYHWEKSRNTLQELDKWEPGSAAAQVYAFFRQHGAVDTTQTGKDRIVGFDPDFENNEFVLGCLDEKTLAWSVHFARLCKTPALRPPALSLNKSHAHASQPVLAYEAEKLPSSTYEELLSISAALKKRDKYLNNAYQYLTAGYYCPGEGMSGCFICGLPLIKIPTFKIEQKRWLTARDKAVKRAGSFGSEPYVAALVKLTTERNSDLQKRIEALPLADPRCKNYLPVE